MQLENYFLHFVNRGRGGRRGEKERHELINADHNTVFSYNLVLYGIIENILIESDLNI